MPDCPALIRSCMHKVTTCRNGTESAVVILMNTRIPLPICRLLSGTCSTCWMGMAMSLMALELITSIAGKLLWFECIEALMTGL